MTMTDRSDEALLARRALAEKATPGPWREAIEPEGDFDDDLTFITTDARCENSKVEIAKLEYTCPYEEKPTAFSFEQRANAAHISANDPTTVMADIDEILRLRAEVERLDKEADCLATWLASAYIDRSLKPEIDNGMSPPDPYQMREAARKAVENATEKR